MVVVGTDVVALTRVRMMRTAVRRRQSGNEPPVGFGRVVQRSAQPEHRAARRRLLAGRQSPRYTADGHKNHAHTCTSTGKKLTFGTCTAAVQPFECDVSVESTRSQAERTTRRRSSKRRRKLKSAGTWGRFDFYRQIISQLRPVQQFYTRNRVRRTVTEMSNDRFSMKQHGLPHVDRTNP